MYYVKSTGMANVLLTTCTANMFVNEVGSAEVHPICSDWSVETHSKFPHIHTYAYGV